MRKLEFYSEEQIAEINSFIDAGARSSIIVKALASKFKRKPKSLMQKIYTMRKGLGLTKNISPRKENNKENTLAPTDKGMTITLYPKSVTIEGSICKLHF